MPDTQDQDDTTSSPQRGKSQLETKESPNERSEVTFVGQRSGRIVRTLKSGIWVMFFLDYKCNESGVLAG